MVGPLLHPKTTDSLYMVPVESNRRLGMVLLPLLCPPLDTGGNQVAGIVAPSRTSRTSSKSNRSPNSIRLGIIHQLNRIMPATRIQTPISIQVDPIVRSIVNLRLQGRWEECSEQLEHWPRRKMKMIRRSKRDRLTRLTGVKPACASWTILNYND